VDGVGKTLAEKTRLDGEKLHVLNRMRSRLTSMKWKLAELAGTTAELKAEEAENEAFDKRIDRIRRGAD
jgi:short-subunit dehydrogenase